MSLVPVFVSFPVNAIFEILTIFLFQDIMLAVLEDSSSSSDDDNVR